MRFLRRTLLARVVFSSLSCSFPLPSSAREWRVSFDGSGDAPTVRAAMDSAQTGDEIVVGPGTFTWTSENAGGDHSMIHVERDVVLRSTAGPRSTVLDAEGIGRVLFFRNAGNARIEEFPMQNGVGIAPAGILQSLGGGIRAFEDSQPHITNCVVRNNRAVGPSFNAFGGGRSAEGSCTVTDCLFYGNSVIGAHDVLGAAIAPDNTADMVVERCTIVANRADGCDDVIGGMYMHSAARDTVTTSIIAWNTGAAVLATSASFSCSNLFGNTGGENVLGVDGSQSKPLTCAESDMRAYHQHIHTGSKIANRYFTPFRDGHEELWIYTLSNSLRFSVKP